MEQKKNSTAALWFVVILFGAVIVLYLVMERNFLFASDPVDIMDVIEADGEATKGEYVSVNVDAVFQNYAETKHSINGIIPTGTEQHYLICLEDNSFISLTVKGKKKIEKLQQIMNDTHAYLAEQTDVLPSAYVMKGRISSMESEIDGYYRDAHYLWGISESDGFSIHYVTIDTSETPLKSWIMFAIFALIEVASIIGLVSESKKKKQLKAATSYYSDDNNNLYK